MSFIKKFGWSQKEFYTQKECCNFVKGVKFIDLDSGYKNPWIVTEEIEVESNDPFRRIKLSEPDIEPEENDSIDLPDEVLLLKTLIKKLNDNKIKFTNLEL